MCGGVQDVRPPVVLMRRCWQQWLALLEMRRGVRRLRLPRGLARTALGWRGGAKLAWGWAAPQLALRRLRMLWRNPIWGERQVGAWFL